jgi:UDP-glucuronate decarboxylase
MVENDGRVVSNFIVQALRELPITIYGRGRQTRSLCYVDDLIDGLELLMASDDEITGPCNLGNPNEMTIAQIAGLIVELTGSRSRITYQPLPQDDPKRRRPSIDKATRLLGWHPHVSIESGLQTTIGYFALQVFSRERAAIVPIVSPVSRRDRKSSDEFTKGGRLVVSPAQQLDM